MTMIHVTATRDFLESLAVSRPLDALSELIWNGFDAESDKVKVHIDTNVMNGIDAKKWLRSSEQQTPIIKWKPGGLLRDVALSTGCARRAVELCVSSTSAARGAQLVGKAGLIVGIEFYAAACMAGSSFQYAWSGV